MLFRREKKINEYTGRGQRGRKITKDVSALSFYTGLLNQFFSRDDLPEEPLSTGEFYYTADTIVTRKGIKKPIIITHLPEEINRCFITDIREDIEDWVDQYQVNIGASQDDHVDISVNLVQDMVHYDLRLDSMRSRGRWVGFVRLYEKVEREMEEKTLEDELKTDKHSDAVRRKVKSFLHIKAARDGINDGVSAAFYKTTLVLELYAESKNLYAANDALHEAEKALKSYCIQNDVKIKRLFLDAHNYYKNYAPTSSYDDNQLIRKKYTGNVYSDDTLTGLVAPGHGKVGDPLGVYHGVDVTSREIVTFDLSKGTDAKNVLVTASTGQGKSRMMKTLLSFYAIDPKYQSVIFDYEGTEYAALGKVSDATTVSIGSGQGVYVNTMVIPKESGDPEQDNLRLSTAKEMTSKVFSIIFDVEDGMSNENQAILSDLMDGVYTEMGVNEEQPEHWYERSKDITFYTIYAKLKQHMEERNDKTFWSKHSFEEVRHFHNTVSLYFAKGATYNSWFKRAVDIDEFLKSKDVIFDFGMGGIGESSVDQRQLALRQLFASHLTTMKSMYNKQKGIRTVVVIEEMQRYLKQAQSVEIVAQFVSGGRKNGLIVYLVTNSPDQILTQGNLDSVNVKEGVGSILNNITMWIIGALPSPLMGDMIDQFGLDNASGYLEQLAEIADHDRKDAPLKYCFYVKYKSYQTIVKFIVHPAFDKSPIYYAAPTEYTESTGLKTAEYRTKEELSEDIRAAADRNRASGGPDMKEMVEKVWL